MPSLPVYKVRDSIAGTPYMVVRFIGAGGMGSVYEVEDTSVGKRYVLKTLNVEFAQGRDASNLEQMMRREARALAQVAHPHIVDVITAGKTADRLGLPFIVMEKLEGVTVRTMLQSVSFPRQSVWQIANELLDALYHLHHPDGGRPAMLHRDIKPENIFLARTHDKKYVTKLLDLGIAVLLDGQAHGANGTPSYMAPEQLRNEPLSEQTDLYQAGCVIFEMLTGRHPFHDAKSATERIEAHLWRDPPRASQLIDVPKKVDDILYAALAKLPARRPRDAHALMAGLHALRDANDAALPVSLNTTVEDLHTAIEKRGESGYLAYASDTGTVDGVSSPPLGGDTLEDAFPALALASTDLPAVPAHKGQTVPMTGARKIDRAAPTRTAPKIAIRRSRQNDTEELEPESPRASAREGALSVRSIGNASALRTAPEATNATPFAGEVAPRPGNKATIQSRIARAGVAAVIGGVLVVVSAMTHAWMAHSGPTAHGQDPDRRAAAQGSEGALAATTPVATSLPSVSNAMPTPAVPAVVPSASAPPARAAVPAGKPAAGTPHSPAEQRPTPARPKTSSSSVPAPSLPGFDGEMIRGL